MGGLLRVVMPPSPSLGLDQQKGIRPITWSAKRFPYHIQLWGLRSRHVSQEARSGTLSSQAGLGSSCDHMVP